MAAVGTYVLGEAPDDADGPGDPAVAGDATEAHVHLDRRPAHLCFFCSAPLLGIRVGKKTEISNQAQLVRRAYLFGYLLYVPVPARVTGCANISGFRISAAPIEQESI